VLNTQAGYGTLMIQNLSHKPPPTVCRVCEGAVRG